MMENLSYKSVVGSPNAPYQTSLAGQCGVATSAFGATHTSAANYLAVSAGQYPAASPPGCGSVKTCADASDNLYSQLTRAGSTWGGYVESMPTPCSPTASGDYTPQHKLYSIGHNPPIFYSSIPAAECRAHDVGVPDMTAQSGAFWDALQNKTLPAFSYVTPNAANNNEGIGTAAQGEQAGDAWLQKLVATVGQSNSYQAGDTLLLISYDEGAGTDKVVGENCADPVRDLPVVNGTSAHQDSCHVPLFVVYPYVRAGDQNATFFTHYSITKTVEQLFALPYLAHAADASTNSLIGSFGIPAPSVPAPPPSVSVDTPTAGSTVSGNAVVVSGSASSTAGIASVAVGFDGGTPTAAAGTTAWSTTVDTTGLPDGAHALNVRVTAADGQVGTTTVPVTVSNPPAPAPNLPPVAAGSAGCGDLSCSFDGSSSSDADGSVASYTWDFGDVTTGSGKLVSHTYASPGDYHYSLTVTDDDGASSTAFAGTVTVTAPPGPLPDQPPSVSIDVPTPGSTVSGSEVAVSGIAASTAGIASIAVGVDSGPMSAATGTTAWSTTVDTTGLTDGAHAVNVQVTAGDAQVATASVPVTVSNPPPPPPPNLPPTAVGSASCTTLSCSFDGSGSADPDGSVVSYAWNFGDGATASGKLASHSYAAAGTYTYSLTVTDDLGLTSTAFTGAVTATAPAPPIPPVGFVAAADSNTKAATPLSGASVVTPQAVHAGDTELLFVSTPLVAVTGTPPGWTLLAQQTASPLQVTIFKRTAVAGDAGAKVTVPVLAASAVGLQLVDYSGVGTGIAAISAIDNLLTTHLTPKVTAPAAGSWVVSFWGDKSSTTTGWKLPAGVVSRDVTIGIGGGHVTGAIADSGAAIAGSYPAQSASVVGGPSGKGITFAVMLPRKG
jgi:PKD repeat protein